MLYTQRCVKCNRFIIYTTLCKSWSKPRCILTTEIL